MRSCMSFKCPSLSIHLFNEYHNLMLVWNPANFVLDSWVTYVLSSYFSDIVLDLGCFFWVWFSSSFCCSCRCYIFDICIPKMDISSGQETCKRIWFCWWGWSGCWRCRGDCHKGRREENQLRWFSILAVRMIRLLMVQWWLLPQRKKRRKPIEVVFNLSIGTILQHKL